jgi:DNA polymerase-3 subunit gamma/tau
VLSVTEVRRLWPEVLEEVKGKRRFTWILLSQNAHVTEVHNGTLVLSMPNAGARDSFSKGGSEDVLREALVVVLGADLKIEAVVDLGQSGIQAGPARPAEPHPTPPPQTTPQRAAASWDAPPRPDVGSTDEQPVVASGRAPDSPPTAPPADPETAVRADPTPAPPSEPPLREQARQRIRPTRSIGARDEVTADDRDAIADRADRDVEEGAASHTELLTRHLGAEIIAEEGHGA